MIAISALGLFVGMIAAILGIGGGVLLVPILHVLLGLDMHSAVGTSLFVIFFLASMAAFSYIRRRLTKWKLALIFECGSIPGAYAGAFASHIVSPTTLKIAFSFLIFYVAYKMWRVNKKNTSSNSIHAQSSNTVKLDKPRIILTLVSLGFVSGFLSGLLGIGGGVVKVPIMHLVLGLPMHNSVATSAFMVCMTTLTGSATHFAMGSVNYKVGAWLIPTSMLGSYIGTKISVKLRSVFLSRIFSILLTFVAARMLVGL